MFDQLISLIIGNEITSERWGTGSNDFITIETDGGIEPSDMLKICGPNFTKTNANVQTHALTDALDQDLLALYRDSHQILSSTCCKCPIVSVCGGGLLAHRYKRKNGFSNPSVYCQDLLKLIIHIQNRVCAFLPTDICEEANLEPISYADAIVALANS